MAEITQVIPDYTGTPPNRFDQLEDEFSDNADFFAAYFATVPTDYNAFATQANAVAVEVNANATLATGAAASSAAAANFEGLWSTLTGEGLSGISVQHDGALWRLVNYLADITASEPSGTNADWVYVSGTRWSTLTASATIAANASYIIVATAGVTELTQPTWEVDDFVVIKNSIDSTQIVRFLNPSNTIKGDIGTISSGDDLIIPAGDTVHLVARSASLLETA